MSASSSTRKSLALFLMAAAAMAVRLPAMRSTSRGTSITGGSSAALSASAGGAMVPAALYDCALVDLAQPVRSALPSSGNGSGGRDGNDSGGSAYVQQLLQNDCLLEQAVKEVRQTLFVYVRAPPRHSSSGNDNDNDNVLEYVSSVYQRLWDEMLTHDRLSLQCVVSAEQPGSGLMTRAEAYDLPQLQAVYTHDQEAAAGLNDALARPVCKSFPIAPGAEVHFFDDSTTPMPRFRKVALGGTFDQIHNGHKKLLALAAAVCTGTIVVGITGDSMLAAKKNAAAISPFAARRAGLHAFMDLAKPAQDMHVVELSDPFGPTITDATVEAIVVSSETMAGAIKINQLRVERGMPPLAVLVTRRSDAATLSSTFLRDRQQQQQQQHQ